MRKTTILCLLAGLLSCVAPSLLAETPRLEGRWDGVIVVRPGEFEVYMKLDLVRTAEGALKGHLSYPAQGDREYGLDSVQVDDDHVFITSTDEQGTVSVFQGLSLEGGKTLRGELTENGRKASFELHRADAAAAVRKPAAPQTLSADGAELKAQFNADHDQVRVLLILSPTCGSCRMGALMVERHLAEGIRDPRLSVYIVWEGIGPHDTADRAAEAAALITDGRIRQFWSPRPLISAAFQPQVGIQRTTAWDVALVFAKAKRWTDSPPAFDLFMHNQKQHQELPKDRLLNAEKLTEEVRGLLAPPPAAQPAR